MTLLSHTACDCNNLGSIDPYCNKDTGQCACRTNAFGRTCSDCERGFWGYPHCRPCACNDLAYDCDFQTGACNNCRNNSGGHNCERFLEYSSFKIFFGLLFLFNIVIIPSLKNIIIPHKVHYI